MSDSASLNSPKPVLIAADLTVEYRVAAQRSSNNRRQKMLASVMGKTEKIKALNEVSFVLHEGDRVGIIGRSGSGKTTLVRVLAGLEKPTHGAVWAESLPSTMSVNGTLLKGLSGSRNIRLSLFALGMNPVEVENRYREILKLLNFKDAIHRPLKSYSGGMLTKLKFAIAVSRAPRILLIDQKVRDGEGEESTGTEVLQSMRESAGAVLLVHKNLGVIAATCNRVIWMERGKIREDGPTEAVLNAFRAAKSNSTKANLNRIQPESAE